MLNSLKLLEERVENGMFVVSIGMNFGNKSLVHEIRVTLDK